MITAAEAKSLEQKKNLVRKETYRLILAKFDRQIRHAIAYKSGSVTLVVPPFIMGLPLYDIPKTTRYMARQLVHLGYAIVSQTENTVEVSWGLTPKIDLSEPEEASLPTLVNLRKMATKIKETKKKHGISG